MGSVQDMYKVNAMYSIQYMLYITVYFIILPNL